MHDTGRELEAAGRKHGVSPFFIAAIAGTESGFARQPCYPNTRNAWGLSSCTSGWHVPWFATWAAAYNFMAKFLHERWPNASSPYDYHGYAACSSCWGAKTAYWMRAKFGEQANTRYPT